MEGFLHRLGKDIWGDGGASGPLHLPGKAGAEQHGIPCRGQVASRQGLEGLQLGVWQL